MNFYEKAFHETLYALGQQHLDNLIVIGGWCPYLYSRYAWDRKAPFPSTVDIDFAVKKMSPDHFSEPVFRKLAAANLVPRKMDMDDENRFQFAYISDRLLIPVEFITTPSVLPKGQKVLARPYVACDPVPEVDIALRTASIRQVIRYKDKDLLVQTASPAAFIVVKGLLLEHRVNSQKLPKDLASIAFVLRYVPDLQNLLNEVAALREHESFSEFVVILKKMFREGDGCAYGMLEPFFQQWGVPRDRVREQIKTTFDPLFTIFRSRRAERRP
ncbi:MAG: hypothetical protein HY548_03390 [Elusimicrobia bacterium]|nr:hypothetical protein [Elusimicrobiota bacterium]